ncbi:oxidoreductase [Nocardia otitidiscaviarum]|uniref:Oxidoreductase n=1 Tax=Nocardia otitidiscaviarum TaxID=1823 RepID=A0A516NHV7_9NOCA|nr:PDR/VanB family oxidoreductase [Nocardia otitidiscaviarum]MCP9618706.1 PDR/VanB family oxidoreductase [Nocardia otitidiscaviarum]QDP78491.1 oxidoreductase [Nocardia otitidiscaviarum]
MTELTVRVTDRRDVAEGVFALDLAAVDGGALPTWSAGAHIDVGVGAAGVRQYSLCGDPADGSRWRIAVLHEPGGRGGSDHLHRTATPGTELSVSLPRNHFPLVAAPEYLFVAGGIGITPILPMLAAAERAGARWTLHYGARTRAHMAFADELARRYPGVNLVPQDEFGLLPLARILAESAATVYCCGPAPLLDAVENACGSRGLAVHTERFTARDTGDAVDREFEIRLAASARTLRVPVGRSIADVLEGAGLPVITSCREGTCGSCETAVLDGEIDHRDTILTAAERERGDTMMLCVSRAHSDVLVLDL